MKNLFLSVVFCLFTTFLSGVDSIVIYIFMLEDCPITQSYTLKLKELHYDFGNEYAFIGVFPNHSSKPEKIEEFIMDYQIGFPTLTDYSKKLVKKFGVTITPEVVVYNKEKEKIIYKGRIDNEFADLGKRRRVVTTDELRSVLESLSLGKEEVFPFTEAVGCFINQNDPVKN